MAGEWIGTQLQEITADSGPPTWTQGTPASALPGAEIMTSLSASVTESAVFASQPQDPTFRLIGSRKIARLAITAAFVRRTSSGALQTRWP
jgi:hypothetical protein